MTETQHKQLKVGTKVRYNGIVGTVYRVNKRIGFLGKPTYDLEVNGLHAEDIQIIK